MVEPFAHHTRTFVEDGHNFVDGFHLGYVRRPVPEEWDQGGGFHIIFDPTLPIEE